MPGWRPLARAIDWPADCYPGLLRHWLLAGCMTGRVVCGSALHTHTHTPFIGSVLHAIHIPRILSVPLALQVSLREQCHNELCPWSCKSLTQLYANKRSMKREAGGRVSLDIRLATSPRHVPDLLQALMHAGTTSPGTPNVQHYKVQST